jgi:flagellar L-ring protein FlgH
MRFARLLLALSLCPATAAGAGSLYDESTYRPIAADQRAHRVGDVITVQVFENSSASSSTDLATERNGSVNANVDIHGAARPYGGTATVGGSFEGGGSTQRANRLLAIVTVTVREVLPSGDLQVAGEQVLVVNKEEQKVTVEGLVRPQDVSADNVVLSTRLANARITFLGEGALSNRQTRPWWRYLLDFVGL